MRTFQGHITRLAEDEVFVFGSNLQGFHGAGSAGYASFNEPGNVWRKHDYANKPDGWQGKWCVKGIGEGPQKGTIGKSYAVPTVTRAGAKRSRTPEEITASIAKLYQFMVQRPHLKFYIAQEASRASTDIRPKRWLVCSLPSLFHPMPISRPPSLVS